MKYIVSQIVGVVFCFACSISIPGQTKAPWKVFSPEEGNFRVELPGVPTFSEKNQSYELMTDFLQYKVSFVRANVSIQSENPTVMKAFWDNYVKKMEAGEGIKAIEQADFRSGSAYGREVMFEQGELMLVNRYLYSSATFYVLITATYKENASATQVKADRTKFLTSFTLLDKVTAKAAQ
jgi:hypothetical protein